MATIKSIYFDFGYVIGYPPPDLERRFLYLDWDGIEPLFKDDAFCAYWKPGFTVHALQEHLETYIYNPWLMY